MIGAIHAAAVIAILPLLLIVLHLLRLGASSVNLAFFTRMQRPPGESGGGMANAIVGTLILIAIAGAVGLPVGIGAGLYLAEKRSTLLATAVRFLADVLNGLPYVQREGAARRKSDNGASLPPPSPVSAMVCIFIPRACSNAAITFFEVPDVLIPRSTAPLSP